MQLTPLTMLGLMAACLTTGAYIPQVVKTWRSGTTDDLSLTMFLMMFTGTICWLIYGFYRNDFPMILANAVAALLSCAILFFKVKDVRQKRREKRKAALEQLPLGKGLSKS
ncbi:MAG: SemiSWEET transporter [Bacteroidota bacterium]